MSDWFSVDKEGLARLMERKGKTKSVLELIQNAWDEDGTTTVAMTLAAHEKRGRSLLVVTDDAPDGFADLADSFTLFKTSKKADNADKRGRFQMGEKAFLSCADEATVISTRGGYRFDAEGRKPIREKRATGSEITAVLRLNAAERAEVAALVQTLLPPAGITTTFNGVPLVHREPRREFTVNLRTEVADAEGILRPTRRNTTVRLFDPLGDETPQIYEMGIPVVGVDLPWHVDIGQKVPLTFERDNVTPAYLKDLRVAVLNNTVDLLDEDQVTSTWVKDATGDDRAEATAVEQVFRKRFGDKAVAFDPSDQQANKEAMLQGYTVVPGRSLSKQEWAQVRRTGVLKPAGQVTPSPKPQFAEDGKPPLPREQWTPGMVRVAEYAQALAKELLGVDITVSIHSTTQFWAAAYGGRHLTFNLMRLGHRWFNEPTQEVVDALLIHEFGHHTVADHLSEAYHEVLCSLGARLRTVAVTL